MRCFPNTYLFPTFPLYLLINMKYCKKRMKYSVLLTYDTFLGKQCNYVDRKSTLVNQLVNIRLQLFEMKIVLTCFKRNYKKQRTSAWFYLMGKSYSVDFQLKIVQNPTEILYNGDGIL